MVEVPDDVVLMAENCTISQQLAGAASCFWSLVPTAAADSATCHIDQSGVVPQFPVSGGKESSGSQSAVPVAATAGGVMQPEQPEQPGRSFNGSHSLQACCLPFLTKHLVLLLAVCR